MHPTASTPRAARPAEGLFALLVAVLLAWNLGSMAWLTVVGRAPVPVNDQWDAAYFPRGLPANLFDTHNEHRPMLGRLVGAVDWCLAAGGNQINATFVFLCFPLFAAALYGLARGAGASRSRAGLAAALALAVMASGEQSENLLWGFQTAFTGSFVFGLVTLAATVAAARSSRPAAWAAFEVCLAASLCAVFSLASGLLILPAVLATLLILKAPNLMRAAYGLFAVVVGACYFHRYGGGSDYDRFGALHHLGAWGLYALSYLGSALQPSNVQTTALCGAVGLVFLAAALADTAARAWSDRDWLRSGPGAARLGLLMFALVIVGAALMAGLGRSRMGAAQALSSRYGTASLAFWADLVVLCALSGVAGAGRLSRVLGMAGWGLGGALALHTALTQTAYFAPAHGQKADRINGMIAYDLGVRDHPAVRDIYAIRETAVSGELDGRFEQMRRERKSIFAQAWPFRLGQPLAAWTRAMPKCGGVVETRMPVAGAKPTLELNGWTWQGARRRVPDLIVFTDDAGRTVGFGQPGYERKDVLKAVDKRAARYSGWRGFAWAAPGDTLHAYGLGLGHDPTACAFADSRPDPGAAR